MYNDKMNTFEKPAVTVPIQKTNSLNQTSSKIRHECENCMCLLQHLTFNF